MFGSFVNFDTEIWLFIFIKQYGYRCQLKGISYYLNIDIGLFISSLWMEQEG